MNAGPVWFHLLTLNQTRPAIGLHAVASGLVETINAE